MSAPAGRSAALNADELVGAIDIGGTHVTAGLVDPGPLTLVEGSAHRLPLDTHGSAADILQAVAEAARAAHRPGVRSWGVAVPGPFDYAAGIARFRDVGKFDDLYGVDMRTALAERLPDTAPEDIRFRNDADAFLVGEWAVGAARGRRRCVGLTFGTGVGSAFLVDGRVVEHGPGVPVEGRIDLLTYEGLPIEETFSRRALLRAYGAPPHPGFDVKDLLARADAGEDRARGVIEHASGALGSVLTPWLTEFAPTCLVIGGAIALGWATLRPSLARSLAGVASLDLIAPTRLGDTAPLLGAAHQSVETR